MAGFTSLGDVYTFVTTRAEGCCAPGDVESVMVEALINIREQLGTAEYYVLGSFNTAADDATYTLPAGVVFPKSLLIDNCALPTGLAACECGGTAEHNGKPDRWEWDGASTITLHPTPDAIYAVTVKGLSAQDYVLKVNDQWRLVSAVLPSGLGLVLARWATALALVDADQNRASTYMSMATTDLENWKERKLGDPSARFVLAGGARRHSHPSFDERFVIR